jgi:hypothetical protein
MQTDRRTDKQTRSDLTNVIAVTMTTTVPTVSKETMLNMTNAVAEQTITQTVTTVTNVITVRVVNWHAQPETTACLGHFCYCRLYVPQKYNLNMLANDKLHTKFQPNPSMAVEVNHADRRMDGRTDRHTRPALYAFLSYTSGKELRVTLK